MGDRRLFITMYSAHSSTAPGRRRRVVVVMSTSSAWRVKVLTTWPRLWQTSPTYRWVSASLRLSIFSMYSQSIDVFSLRAAAAATIRDVSLFNLWYRSRVQAPECQRTGVSRIPGARRCRSRRRGAWEPWHWPNEGQPLNPLTSTHSSVTSHKNGSFVLV